MKKLITAGCSFTIDNYQKTWADYLAISLNYKLVNVAGRGAGLGFISKRLILSLQDEDPNNVLVGIMLPSSDRFDYYVDKAHVLKNNFINISSWQDGKNPSLINLDGTLSTESGYSLTGGEPRGDKKHWYKLFYNPTESYINYWFNVVLIQNYLKLHKFKYFFTSAYNLKNTIEQSVNQNLEPIECSDLTKLVDFDNFILYKERLGFLDYVKLEGFNIVDHYPETQAHEKFVADIIVPQVNKCLV
jgi:hypothetical protein